MTRSEQEFRDFVAGFADPLARLAFLLSAGTELDPLAMTAAALASVRRRWHDVEATGAPEPLAVEAFVSALPRPRRRVTAAPPAVPASDPDDVDDGLLRAAAWTAWTAMSPRHRVPLLLDDLSVAAQRLAGIDVPQSARSARRGSAAADGARRFLREALLADAATCRWVGAHDDVEFVALVRDALREQAAKAPTLLEPSARVRRQVYRSWVRAAGAVAASLVVLVAAGAVAVRASAPKKEKAPPVSASVVADSVSDRGPVVAWPTRGTAAHNGPLITQLKAAFLHAHPDTTGQVQVLLVTDTSTYRIAYVTAKSPTGVLESWFYGPVGSNDLVEGVVQYGGGLDARTEILATGLSDAQGHTQLVVVAAPGTRTMRLAVAGAAPAALRNADGVAVKAVPTGTISSLSLDVRVGQTHVVSNEMRTLALGPRFQGVAAPFEPEGAPSFPVERGHPDQQTIAQAAGDAELWAMQDGAANRLQMKVLWAGTDQVGSRMVVVRMKMDLADMLLVVASDDDNDVPRQEAIDLAAPSTPDAPLAFSYLGSGDARVAVLGSPGDTSAALAFQGKQLPAVPLDDTGFASFPVSDESWLTSPGLAVNLLGPAGNVLKTIPIPAL